MILKKNTWQISIFFKLVIIFLVVIIPLYTISLLINERGSSSISREISSSVMSKVHFYLNSLETEISHIKSRQLEYIMDDNLQMLCVTAGELDSFDTVKAVNDLQKKLQIMKNSSIYIENASIHIPSLGQTISSKRILGAMPQEKYNFLLSSAEKNNSTLIFYKGDIFLSAYYPDPVPKNSSSPMYLFEIELSVKELGKALSGFSSYTGDGFVLMNREQNWFVSGKKDDGIMPVLSRFLQQKNIRDRKSGTDMLKYDNKNYLIAFETSSYLNMTLVAYVPEEQFMGSLNDYRIWFWVLCLLSILIVIFFSYSIYQLIYRPLHQLVYSFSKVDADELDIAIAYNGNDEFRYVFEHFNIMVEKLKGLVKRIFEEQILYQRAELKQLQSQINPHFLYNSFYLIYRMAKEEDYGNVCRTSQLLGEYYKFITRNASDEIPLYMEFNHAKAYVEIQNIRFSNRIQVDFDELPDSLKEIPVPRLILQPVIENAFEHGLKNKLKNGKLKVEISSTDDRICIAVEDNGEEITDEILGKLQEALSVSSGEIENTGLLNVHKRIRIKFGSDFGLGVSRGQLGGLRVEMGFKKVVDISQ